MAPHRHWSECQKKHTDPVTWEQQLFSEALFVKCLISRECGALGRAIERSTSDHWVLGSKTGVFKSGTLSSFISLSGARSFNLS